MGEPLVPAAQYLRMSTDHQQYSLRNQAEAIERYAKSHNYQIINTYSDAAKSGLRIKNRPGLQQLLKDVVSGDVTFKGILVYDVSRWGRFQDNDEAAHYEYICKSAGVFVHYCAEGFTNDNNAAGLILKALKRTMAAEYSRELSVKTRAGLLTVARLGFKLGGSPVYGLRRQLVDSSGQPKQLLFHREQKNLSNDRVVLVPGPANEVAIVRRIYREFAYGGRSPESIAQRLNRANIGYFRGLPWKGHTIRKMLEDAHYAGFQVWGKTTAMLLSPPKAVPIQEWAICPRAFERIIPEKLYLAAQHRFANLTCRLTNSELLDRLRRVFNAHGKLNSEIINKSPHCPGTSTYSERFGGLLNVYARVGYLTSDVMRSQVSTRQRVLFVRSSLIKTLIDCFPDELEEIRANRHFRPMLRHRKTGRMISLVLARCCQTASGASWPVLSPVCERGWVTVLGLLDRTNTSIEMLKVFPGLPDKTAQFRIRPNNDWLNSGKSVNRVCDFLDVVEPILASCLGTV